MSVCRGNKEYNTHKECNATTARNRTGGGALRKDGTKEYVHESYHNIGHQPDDQVLEQICHLRGSINPDTGKRYTLKRIAEIVRMSVSSVSFWLDRSERQKQRTDGRMAIPFKMTQGGARESCIKIKGEDYKLLVRVVLSVPAWFTTEQIRLLCIANKPDFPKDAGRSALTRVIKQLGMERMKLHPTDPRKGGGQARKEELASFKATQTKSEGEKILNSDEEPSLNADNSLFIDETAIYQAEKAKQHVITGLVLKGYTSSEIDLEKSLTEYIFATMASGLMFPMKNNADVNDFGEKFDSLQTPVEYASDSYEYFLETHNSIELVIFYNDKTRDVVTHNPVKKGETPQPKNTGAKKIFVCTKAFWRRLSRTRHFFKELSKNIENGYGQVALSSMQELNDLREKKADEIEEYLRKLIRISSSAIDERFQTVIHIIDKQQQSKSLGPRTVFFYNGFHYLNQKKHPSRAFQEHGAYVAYGVDLTSMMQSIQQKAADMKKEASDFLDTLEGCEFLWTGGLPLNQNSTIAMVDLKVCMMAKLEPPAPENAALDEDLTYDDLRLITSELGVLDSDVTTLDLTGVQEEKEKKEYLKKFKVRFTDSKEIKDKFLLLQNALNSPSSHGQIKGLTRNVESKDKVKGGRRKPPIKSLFKFMEYTTMLSCFVATFFGMEILADTKLLYDNAPYHGVVKPDSIKASDMHSKIRSLGFKNSIALPVRNPRSNIAEAVFSYIKHIYRAAPPNIEGKASFAELRIRFEAAIGELTPLILAGYIHGSCYPFLSKKVPTTRSVRLIQDGSGAPMFLDERDGRVSAYFPRLAHCQAASGPSVVGKRSEDSGKIQGVIDEFRTTVEALQLEIQTSDANSVFKKFQEHYPQFKLSYNLIVDAHSDVKRMVLEGVCKEILKRLDEAEAFLKRGKDAASTHTLCTVAGRDSSSSSLKKACAEYTASGTSSDDGTGVKSQGACFLETPIQERDTVCVHRDGTVLKSHRAGEKDWTYHRNVNFIDHKLMNDDCSPVSLMIGDLYEEFVKKWFPEPHPKAAAATAAAIDSR